MRRALFALALITMAHAQAPPVQGITTLAALRNTHRVLLIFASKPDDPQLEIQLRTLNEHAVDATERDLVAIAIASPNPSPTVATLSPLDASTARHRFNVPPGDFAVVLIGKDGGEKLRSHKPITMRELNTTIDSMPMRQDEIHDRATQQ